jgi:hypothetical protein
LQALPHQRLAAADDAGDGDQTAGMDGGTDVLGELPVMVGLEVAGAVEAALQAIEGVRTRKCILCPIRANG